MRLCVLAAGRLKKSPERSLLDDFASRISRYARFSEIEVLRAEQLEAKLPKDHLRVALEVGGQSYDSTGLARALQAWGRRGKGDVCFIIGGPDGIPKQLSESAEFQLSLSSLTLPHRLARVLLFEQLYRAFCILNNEPYAREG